MRSRQRFTLSRDQEATLRSVKPVFDQKAQQRFRESERAPRRLWLFTTRAELGFWDARFEDGDGLVFGNEGSGAPDWLHRELEAWRVTIPHANPDLRSLNLSTAAGVAAYEALRQTGGLGGHSRILG